MLTQNAITVFTPGGTVLRQTTCRNAMYTAERPTKLSNWEPFKVKTAPLFPRRI